MNTKKNFINVILDNDQEKADCEAVDFHAYLRMLLSAKPLSLIENTKKDLNAAFEDDAFITFLSIVEILKEYFEDYVEAE